MGNDIIADDLVKQIPNPNWKEIAEVDGLADRFAKEKIKKKELKTNQLRKFFDDVKRIESKVRDEQKWDVIEGELYKLVPTIKYAQARKLCPKQFVEFVTKSIDKVCEDDGTDKKDKLRNFTKIFEYVVAYRKYHDEVGGR